MSVICRTDVTAVKLYEEFILAGIGSWVNVFDRKCMKLVQKIHVLNGQKIYHFVPLDKNKILVIGGKQFSIITRETKEKTFVKCFEAIVCNDWLHSGVWVSDVCVALLTAHNVVQIWDTVQKCMISEYISKENSILYSGLLLPIEDDILVFSGTVFSQVLIHRCGRDGVLHTLKGHKGVIFSVSCNPQKGVIVTTSDDRAVRIWQLQNNSSFIPNSIGYWDNVNITCIHELYGHLARVMRNCIRDDFVISIGEDSCICFWSYNGSLLRKVATHQNACIWSLDADDKHLVTGGGDSSVILHPLSMVTEYGENEVVNAVSNAKNVVFTARRNIVILTDDNLIYYDVFAKSSATINLKHDSTCKLLSVSSCKQIIAVVDMFGKLDIFIESCKGEPCIQNFIDTNLQIGKILFMQWTGNRHLVLCSENGTITVLASKNNSIDLYANFILPPCKERWLTAAAMNLRKDMLVVGDRCGSLHLYITGQKNPLKSFKKVHGRYGPTSINFESDKIVTTGRCGSIKYFKIDNDCNINLMSSRNLDFQWIEKFVDKENRYISGFQERVFVIYDMRNHCKLLEVPCGGGHRSWDVIRYIEKVDDFHEEFIKFVYLKNSNINIETFELNKIVSKNVINGTHSKEINCLKTYISTLDDSTTFYISGGEDTSLRISSINSSDEFRDEVIFKQLSSVRTLKTSLLEDNKLLLVSAGGRAQICIKLFQFHKNDTKVEIVPEELTDYLIKGTDKKRKGSQTWRNCSVDFDPETRIMDVDIIKCDDNNLIIVAGCSDAYLRVFHFRHDGKNAVLSPLQNLKHNDTCILKTHSFEYSNNIILITCTTRGIVTFWEIANADNLERLQLQPFFSHPVHQSGINSLAIKVMDKGILLATGGDDNTLHLNLIEISEELKTFVKHEWRSNILHCSQITGLELIDDLILTTSIDQRITMLRWEVGPGIKCEFVSQVFSDVADIQGMDVLKYDSASIKVCVFGKGFEVISMPRPSQ